jgi:hypothetical protein
MNNNIFLHNERKGLQIVAEAIVEAGYGTDWYDPKENERHHSCYASFIKIISGDWSEYDTDNCAMDQSLNTDFNIGFTFGTYLIRKYSDGTRRSEKVDWDYTSNCVRK